MSEEIFLDTLSAEATEGDGGKQREGDEGGVEGKDFGGEGSG